MPRTTDIKEKGIIWIPPDVSSPCFKIEIIKTNGNTETITSPNNVRTLSVTLSNTNSVSSFNLVLINKSKYYTGMFYGGEDITIYFGYNNTYNKKFKGRIEIRRYGLDMSGSTVTLSGRSYGYKLLNKKANTSYDAVTITNIIKATITGLMPKYISGITTNNVATITETATISFRNTSVQDSLKKLAERGYTFYVDANKDLNFFAEGSRENATEAAVEGVTIKSYDIGVDIKEIVNKITLYGKSLSSDVFYLGTKANSGSQSSYDINEEVMTKSSIDSNDEIGEELDTVLAQKIVLLEKGYITCLGMPTLSEGEMIRISSPSINLNSWYLPTMISHTYDANNGFLTTLQIEEVQVNLVTLLKDRLVKEEELIIGNNPNEMTDSYAINFETDGDIETFSNAQILDNKLQLIIGVTEGNCYTVTKTLSYTPNYCEFRIDGDDLNISRFRVSFDNGSNYQEVLNKSLITIANKGRQVKIKIELNKDSNNLVPSANNCSILYKE